MDAFDKAIFAINVAHADKNEAAACARAFADAYLHYRMTDEIERADALAISTVEQHIVMMPDCEAAAALRDLIRGWRQ
jgi:hypothetical protein